LFSIFRFLWLFFLFLLPSLISSLFSGLGFFFLSSFSFASDFSRVFSDFCLPSSFGFLLRLPSSASSSSFLFFSATSPLAPAVASFFLFFLVPESKTYPTHVLSLFLFLS
jgi:hypothetical protein